MKLAIISGITDYNHMKVLPACTNDAVAVRNLLNATGDYPEICFIDPDSTAAVAKSKIVEFIKRHQSEKIDELIFYFSGHGDRSEDDFFYAFSDYKNDYRETTGLRNSELDELIRNLTPALTVKIVDACFSGSTYIKAEDDFTPVIQKSATTNELKRAYFFFSSAANEKSLAGPKYSYFTQCLLEVLLAQQPGLVRYRDLISAMADGMSRRGWPKPFFVTQATGLENFAYMGDAALGAVKESLMLIDPQNTAESKNLVGPTVDDQEASGLIKTLDLAPSQPLSLAMLAKEKADEIYCTKEEAVANLELLKTITTSTQWPVELLEAYEMQVKFISEDDVPNGVAIGNWIKNYKEDSVFASPTYKTETFTAQEYKELPRKPLSTFGALGSSMSHMRRLLGEDKEYKLESVEKARQVISGFQFSVPAVADPALILFTPRFSSLENYAVSIVCLFSRRSITCLYSIEHLAFTGWDTTVSPKALKWKQVTSSIKDVSSLREIISSLIVEVTNFITADARQRLSAGS